MFNIGDVIVYGAQGICRIDSFDIKQIGKVSADYYVLKPLFNESTSVFVPVENAVLTAKMQAVLTKSEAQSLVKNAPDFDVLCFANDGEKQTEYKAILSSGNRDRLAALIKTIYTEKETRRIAGKKLNIFDEQTLRKAEQLLYNELAFVLDISPDEIKNKIKF